MDSINVVSSTNIICIQWLAQDYGTFKVEWTKLLSSETTVATQPLTCTKNSTVYVANDVIEIHSNRYFTSYLENSECHWKIMSTKSNYHVSLYFVEMNLEDVDQCAADFVTVGQTKDFSKILVLDKLCANRRNMSITKYHGIPHLTLDFVSDSYINGFGFKGYAQLECGSSLSSSFGQISVEPNETSDCTWYVSVSAGNHIQFELESINIAMNATNSICKSTLEIRTGFNEVILGQYCGSIPVLIPKTNGNFAIVKFIPFDSSANDSFKLTYKSISYDCSSTTLLTGERKQVMLDGPQCNNCECVMTIIATKGSSLQIQFNDWNFVERNCNFQFVEVREIGTVGSVLQYCKSSPPLHQLSTNMVRIRFQSNGQATNGPPSTPYFKVDISAVQCGGQYDRFSGVIESNNYENHAKCLYKIISKPEHSLVITFANITSGSNITVYCYYYLNTETFTQYFIEIGSNAKLLQQPIMCNGAYALIIVATQSNTTSTFYCEYSTTEKQLCGSSTIIKANSGTIHTPDFPGLVDFHGLNCNWPLQVPKDRRVCIHIAEFRSSITSVNDILKFCNDFECKNIISVSENNLKKICSTDNIMMISSKSIGRENIAFSLEYTSYEQSVCGENFGILGIIYAPNTTYPHYCLYQGQSEDIRSVQTIYLQLKSSMRCDKLIKDESNPLYTIFFTSEDSMTYWPCDNEPITISAIFNNIQIIEQQVIPIGAATIAYKLNDCGDIYSNKYFIVINEPSFADHDYGFISCLWQFNGMVNMDTEVSKFSNNAS